MESWTNLAEAVKQRRALLGLRQADIPKRGGPSLGTVKNIEQVSSHRPSLATLFQLDRALDWPAGTAQRVVAGVVPVHEVVFEPQQMAGTAA